MHRVNPESRAQLSALLIALPLLVAACGGGDDGNGPPSVFQDDDKEIVASVMGMCRKLCCADSDCGTGSSCRPFDSSAGTLGACTADAPAKITLDTELPPGCWSLNTPECQPLSLQGCDEGEICDFDEGDDMTDPAILCSSGLEAHEDGETCDAVYGPYCKAGYHCVPNAE